jgi:hypothetical protein
MPHQPATNEIRQYGAPFATALSPGLMKKMGEDRLKDSTNTETQY